MTIRRYTSGVSRKKESGEPVSSIAVVSRNEKAQSCEIGYCISRSRWHKGITTEALAEVMRYLFEEVGVLRLSPDMIRRTRIPARS